MKPALEGLVSGWHIRRLNVGPSWYTYRPEVDNVTSAEAYEWICFAQLYLDRLSQARAALLGKPDLDDEKKWMELAVQLLEKVRPEAERLAVEARQLPELGDARADAASQLQCAWVDALERLHAGITFHISSRSPLIEAIFPHTKFAPLRRAAPEKIRPYATEVHRRLQSAYVTRMMGEEEFTFARRVLEDVSSFYDSWQTCFSETALLDDPGPLRASLAKFAERMDMWTRQARLLAEAAFCAHTELFASFGLDAKPRKKTHRAAPSQDTEAVVNAPPDVPSDSRLDGIEEVVCLAPDPESAPAPESSESDGPAKSGGRQRKRIHKSKPEQEAPSS